MTASTIQNFEIEGGKQLSGTITTNTSKNGSVGLLCAALINRGKTTLHGIARIEEVNRMIEILESIGVSIAWTGEHTIELQTPETFDLTHLNLESALRTRSIIMLAGPLIHFLPKFYLPHAQGCELGKRTVSAHIYGLEDMGVEVEVTNDRYIFRTDALKPAEIIMYESSDTGAENLITAAALTPGTTTIKFTSSNYMVREVCYFLQKLGVQIDGVGTSTLVIHGVTEINTDIEYWNSEDPIESMMWITAAIATDSELKIMRCPIDFLELELYKLKKMGLLFEQSAVYKSENGHTDLCDLTIFPSILYASEDKIEARPYPGINPDNLPFFGLIAAKARGQTLIHDWMFENRATYLTELKRLGVKVLLADPHRVFIQGMAHFKNGKMSCPPALRPSVVIMLAMLAAPGKSTLRNVYMINRGYEDIVGRFNSIGADIKSV